MQLPALSYVNVPPNAATSLSVEIKLKSGQVLKSWTDNKAANPGVADSKRYSDKPISVNPAQGAAKATYSRKTVSLNRGAPLAGQAITLGLASKANPDMRIGAVSIDYRKLDPALEKGGFVLERSGGDEWTIYFADGKAPKAWDKNAKAFAPGKLGASYTVPLRLWPEGTYAMAADPVHGPTPVALGSGKGVSQPIVVNVTVKVLP